MKERILCAEGDLCLRITGAAAIAATLIAILALPLAAQRPVSGHGSCCETEPTPAAALAVRANPHAPRIDGVLDEQVWQDATPITEFVQRDPDEGSPGTEQTEVRVAYTNSALFLAVRAWDSRPDQIAAQLTRRDEDSPSDWIGVAIDSYRDRRTAFVFLVNPVGVKRDIYFFDDTNEDSSWDAVWDVATVRDSAGWTAEFRIPFSQLRFPNGENHTFGFNVYRKINRLNEEQWWRLPPKEESGMVSKFGDLEGIDGISPPRRLEFVPYTAATAEFEPRQVGNPFRDGTNQNMRFGGDLYYGLTSNLTLSATVNPDFGQVEADPAVVNLSAFETFFPEKRPFFNEGLDIFRFSIGLGDGDGASESLFYTRRIGRAPQGRPDLRDGVAEAINQTTIYTAAKLSGKTPSGWTVGLTGALTAEESAHVVDSEGVSHWDVVEPRTSYVVGTVARDFRGGLTKVGFFATGVNRSLTDNLDWLRNRAYAVATNWSHRFLDDRYSFDGWIAASHVAGSEQAIELTQRSSARYYQRPDANHLTYDPTRTSLSGYSGQVSFGKHAGNWRFSTGIDTRSPGFEVNDMGFQQDADRSIQWTWLSHRWLKPGKLLRRAQINFNQWSAFSYGWEKLAVGGNLNTNFTFRNYWGGYFGGNREWSGLSTGSLRGGPAIIRPGGNNAWAGVYTDSRKKVRASLNGWAWQQDESNSWRYGLSTNLSWRAASSLELSAAPSLNRGHDQWQYMRQADALDDTQYMFGELKQTTVSSTFRGSFTLTPTLSLQLYWQPFISSGKYVNYKRVIDPRGQHFDDRFEVFDEEQVIDDEGEISIDINRDGNADVELGNPDFTYLSFRSNAVIRWEYRPGSTVFLVWQHGRGDYNTNGQFDLGQGLNDLFSAAGTNTLVLKVTYWLGR